MHLCNVQMIYEVFDVGGPALDRIALSPSTAAVPSQIDGDATDVRVKSEGDQIECVGRQCSTVKQDESRSSSSPVEIM